MKRKGNYLLNQNCIYQSYSEINRGISFDIKKRLGESTGTISIFDSDFVGYTIKVSLDKHLKKLLELLLKVEEGDEDPSGTLMFCLDESERLRRQFINKYDRFLEKKQKDFLERKIDIIQKDIKNKLVTYRLSMMAMSTPQNNYYEEAVEERHRTR